MKEIQVIAYYLPQFHIIPENNEWWGENFTEWVNVKNAKSFFPGHKQPNIPTDELGYYNLLDDSVRRKQAALAKEAGIDGFCYWHYWFGDGKELLEKPFKLTLADKENDFGFCLGWANESWQKKQWRRDGSGDVTLIEQKYCGKKDDENHFYAYLSAFKDPRYMRCNGKPIFLIYKPFKHPYVSDFITHWNQLAKENGLEGFCFVAELGSNFKFSDIEKLKSKGFSYVTTERSNLRQGPLLNKMFYIIKNFILRRPIRSMSYKSILPWAYTKKDNEFNILPGICPNWDHSPRSGRLTNLLYNPDPKLFGKLAKKTLIINKEGKKLPILFIKSWNEWGEGNYMEPDTVFGKGYINALRKAIDEVYGLK